MHVIWLSFIAWIRHHKKSKLRLSPSRNAFFEYRTLAEGAAKPQPKIILFSENFKFLNIKWGYFPLGVQQAEYPWWIPGLGPGAQKIHIKVEALSSDACSQEPALIISTIFYAHNAGLLTFDSNDEIATLICMVHYQWLQLSLNSYILVFHWQIISVVRTPWQVFFTWFDYLLLNLHTPVNNLKHWQDTSTFLAVITTDCK